jgi:drug/metabolite transporter (DMT)-like permease
MGLCAYGADLFFFWVLDHIDVSVLNGGWAMLSILLSIAGFLLFHESWTLLQTAGAALIIGGVVFLSFHNPTHGSLARTLGLLFAMALFYVPSYIAKKAALDAGQDAVAVFFWLIIGRETVAFVFPWCVRSYRARIKRLARTVDKQFFAIGAAVIACFLFGEYMGALAFQVGPISLVSVVSNIQPFVVIALAALLARLAPAYAAKEALTTSSVAVKLVSFLTVFLGLALLALPK